MRINQKCFVGMNKSDSMNYKLGSPNIFLTDDQLDFKTEYFD